MTELVINTCPGHFGLSRLAFLRLRELGNEFALSEPDYGEPWPDSPKTVREKYLGDQFCVDIERTDPDLIFVIRELGADANGMDAKLKIVMAPHDDYTIHEDDGKETVE